VLAEDDLDALCLVPGVGKKTAARLLIELKSKLDIPGLDIGALTGTAVSGSASSSRKGTPLGDVRDALVELGYSSDEIADAVRSLPEDVGTSELLRLALQQLAS
jgi:Holliday junction DNA helicase RuvA